MGASRKDKLGGTRQVIGGVAELVLAADPELGKTDRWFVLGFGATSLVVGVGRMRGSKGVQTVGTAAGAALGVVAPFTAFRAKLRSTSDLSGAPSGSESDRRPDRREQVRGLNDLVGGVISLVIAADPTMGRSQRVSTGTIGASAISGGLGRLTGNQSAMAIGSFGYLVALTVAMATAFRRFRQRRA
ncbi:MAG: hypothetical protein Q7T55_02665 [Solirubrobacteraceae bacterium]|nr:hypothetical protein [Solirubrobacteraceae bacterium]